MKSESWHSLNDSRNYPLIDGTERAVDGRIMPTNLIVDAHISTPSSYMGRVYVSTVRMAKPRVEITISIETGVLDVLRIDVQNPQAYRSYAMRSLLAGYSGYIVFGSGIETGLASFNAEFTVDQAEILPSLIVRSPSLPFTEAGAPDGLTGVVPIEGRDGVLVRFRQVWDPVASEIVGALVIELEDRLEVLEAPLNECQIPIETGLIPSNEMHPVVSINGVYPDANGRITLELDAATFTYDDNGVDVVSPVVTVGLGGSQPFLSFRSVIDLSEVCGAAGASVITYPDPRCIPCPDDYVQSGSVSLGQAFIHRDYLVIEFLYNGPGSLEGGAGAVTLDPVALFVNSTHSIQVGYGVRFVYDVDENCEPVDPSPQEARPGRLVYRLNKVVRDTHAHITLIAPAGLMVESPADPPPGYAVQESPALDICLPVHDPFVFDSDFMDPATEAEINQEIQDYIDGNPPWAE